MRSRRSRRTRLSHIQTSVPRGTLNSMTFPGFPWLDTPTLASNQGQFLPLLRVASRLGTSITWSPLVTESKIPCIFHVFSLWNLVFFPVYFCNYKMIRFVTSKIHHWRHVTIFFEHTFVILTIYLKFSNSQCFPHVLPNSQSFPCLSGVITDGGIGGSLMVKLMGDIREIFADWRCHFNNINLDFYTPFC